MIENNNERVEIIIKNNKLWEEELIRDNKREVEEIPDDKNMEQLSKEIENKEKTSELSSEIKPDKNQENIKRREMKSKKMRRMHPRNLIKTQEELEMMHSGLINVLNIPMTHDKEIMNFKYYRRRSKEISVTVSYTHLDVYKRQVFDYHV